MQKPNNYDNTKASGDFTPVEPGGHYITIKQLSESQSKKGRPMIVVLFDFVEPDRQKGYFMDSFKSDVRPEKKWPRNGTQYIVTEDEEGKCSRSFKTFINCVEKSNPGFITQWGDGFAAQFKGKKIGGVFGKVENEYNGKVSMRSELRWFCKWESVKDANVPDPKYLPDHNVTQAAPQQVSDSDVFMPIPDDAPDEIPF